MSPYYEIENIKKDLKFGFDEIIVACRDCKTKKLIEKACQKSFGREIPGKVRFCTLKQFNGSDKGAGLDSTVSAPLKKQTKKNRNGPGEQVRG